MRSPHSPTSFSVSLNARDIRTRVCVSTYVSVALEGPLGWRGPSLSSRRGPGPRGACAPRRSFRVNVHGQVVCVVWSGRSKANLVPLREVTRPLCLRSVTCRAQRAFLQALPWKGPSSMGALVPSREDRPVGPEFMAVWHPVAVTALMCSGQLWDMCRGDNILIS